MSSVEIKKVDRHGRIVLPFEWRRKVLKDDEVLVIAYEDRVEVIPRTSSLADFINSVEIDAKNFEDYHRLRKELRARGQNEVR